MTQVICAKCREPFDANASEVRRGGGKYCSAACYHGSQITSVTRECLQCGKPFRARQAVIAAGFAKFCSTSCAKSGERHHAWQGGRARKGGYIMVHTPGHPQADAKGYVPEHRLVAERAIGRYLPREAEVHHINEIRDDNRPTNLVVCPDRAYHMGIHGRVKRRALVIAAGGDPSIHLLCSSCKVPKPFDAFHRNRRIERGRVSACTPCLKKRAVEKEMTA